jgi:hypothetical protein
LGARKAAAAQRTFGRAAARTDGASPHAPPRGGATSTACLPSLLLTFTTPPRRSASTRLAWCSSSAMPAAPASMRCPCSCRRCASPPWLSRWQHRRAPRSQRHPASCPPRWHRPSTAARTPSRATCASSPACASAPSSPSRQRPSTPQSRKSPSGRRSAACRPSGSSARSQRTRPAA